MTDFQHLSDRALIEIGGPEATDFLANLVTCDVEDLAIGELAFGALLAPQGKILFDFFLLRTSEGFLLECLSSQRPTLLRRLMFYRLRAQVTLENDVRTVLWSPDAGPGDGFADPRHAKMGCRKYDTDPKCENGDVAYRTRAIACGLPELGHDFAPDSTYPHEALMDQIGDGSGVDFQKGCYVGQEVVSRMQHRGTARSRFVKVASEGSSNLPPMGTAIVAVERSIGTMGSSVGPSGLALIRLDRAQNARENQVSITADDISLSLELPDFVDFGWPDDKGA